MIRKMAFLVLIAFAFVPLQVAKAQAARTNASTTSQTLIALENRWTTAVQNSDAAVVDSIIADSFVGTDERGERTNKQGDLAILKSGDLKIQSFKLSALQVHAYGDAAVVTGAADVRGTFKGQSLAQTIAFTDVFVRQSGHWRAVASHESTVSK
jgi:ketosteroid isomerase-like protein